MELNRNINFVIKKKAAEQLIEKNGVTHLGWFDRPFKIVNVTNSKIPGIFGISDFLVNMRRKQWQYFSCISKDCLLGSAIVNTGYASNSFLYIYDFSDNKFIEIESTVPALNIARVAQTSVSGSSYYKWKDYHIRVSNNLDESLHDIVIDCKDKKGNHITADVKVFAEGEPLVNSREVLPGRIVYTHQNSMYRAGGRITWNDKEYILSQDKDFAGMDYTQGLHQYYTTWNWASAGGFAEDGTALAINLAMDINEGTNCVPAYWIGKNIYRLPEIKFEYPDIDSAWSMKDPDGFLDITFNPVGKRHGKMNTGIFKYDFTQPFGYFTGTMKDSEGKSYKIKEMKGVTEEHYAWW